MKQFTIPCKLRSGSHGGAWKVAYADFVTGMMSLFLVLWILSQDEEVIIATTRFFRDPYMAGVPKSTPVEQKDARPGSMVDQIVGRSDTTMRNTDETSNIDVDILHRIAKDWYSMLKQHELDDDVVQIEVANERIHVTIFHGDDKPLFEQSSPKLTSFGRKVVNQMGWLLDRHLLISRVDSHTNHLTDGRAVQLANLIQSPSVSPSNSYNQLSDFDQAKLAEWKMSLDQAYEVLDHLTYSTAPIGGNSDLLAKIEGLKGHGSTVPNKRFPNRPDKNRRVELSLVVDKSKASLAQYPKP
jgi:flagellar motor protein MotB